MANLSVHGSLYNLILLLEGILALNQQNLFLQEFLTKWYSYSYYVNDTSCTAICIGITLYDYIT